MLPIAPRAPQYVPFVDSERRGALRPVWSRKGTAMIEAFGATPGYDDIAVVAAFPLETLQSGRPFAIYKALGGVQEVRIGVLRADDADAWR